MPKFKLRADYSPTGDQPDAIKQLVNGLNKGYKYQTLLGVTGSGKTFTMANIIEKVQRPILVLSHNKTLAAQLWREFKEYFPENAVEYFVSYYDYYQPEAYMPRTDTYIAKETSINAEIEKLRQSATVSLMSRRDVIVVASVSCIYGLGSPSYYKRMMVLLKKGQVINRKVLFKSLVDIQYERNDMGFDRGKFRVRGDTIDIFPTYYGDNVIRIEMFGNEIENISEIDFLKGEIIQDLPQIAIFPARHYVVPEDMIQKAIKNIRTELDERLAELKAQNKLIEHQRLEERVNFDIEMLENMGYCTGIENYSRFFDDRVPGDPPFTLLDYFPEDFILFIDESHETIPQVRGMYWGDKSRKDNLIDYGFRLPAARDNRPLTFEEFEERLNQVIFVSATPAEYELEHSTQVAELIVRPTGLLEPEIIMRPIKGQIDDTIAEANKRVQKNERVLITTLTKRMAEELTNYLQDLEINARYLHSEIGTIERMQILRELRLGTQNDGFDVLVGINLLREGLDLPEVSLVCILDADKVGFLRSEMALIQTAGRASRNLNGQVIMYADKMTDALTKAINEISRRRNKQIAYNKKHGIKPRTIIKPIQDALPITMKEIDKTFEIAAEDMEMVMHVLEKQMKEAADNLEFEKAALLRDRIFDLKSQMNPKRKKKKRKKNM
ncbi:MAG: excinuclease ABC subunit UvrB [Candidatus Helarchaeota archaeon]